MEDQSGAVLGAGLLIGLLLFYVAIIVFSVYLYVRVARKAGYSGWWAAMMFVPLGNIVVMIMFALVEWPIEREVKALRARTASGYGQSASAAPPPLPGRFGQPAVGPGQGFAAPHGISSGFAHGPGYGTDPLPSQPVFGRPEERPPGT